MKRNAPHIWIDLDNSPHVPFFLPIIAALQDRGHPVLVTARDAYNVVELLELHHLSCRLVGRHFGRHKLMKALGLGVRAAQLLPLALMRRPQLAVSHGSRAQLLAAKILRIPSVLIADYEHVTHVTQPDCIIVPEVIPDDAAGRFASLVLKFPGIKEDVYAATFSPDPSILAGLGLADTDIIVTVRPPATEAHYHDARSDELFEAAMAFLIRDEGTRIVLLPRNEHQKAEWTARHADSLQSGKVIVPAEAVDGLNLVWHSDLVISGGGTMNREAAALGVPVYSTFRGPIGAVDRYLAARGRLVLLEQPAQVAQQVVLAKRSREGVRPAASRAALDAIVGHLAAALGERPYSSPALESGEG